MPIDGNDKVKFQRKIRSIVHSLPNAQSNHSNSVVNDKQNAASYSLIDPIWITMLTLYIKQDKSMASNKLAKKFAGEMPTSSVDRYFRFMHEMNLVETKQNNNEENGIELKLTSRAVRLVESGLRNHG